MKRFLLFLILVLISFSWVSCKKNRNTEISLDTSDPLALAVDVEWAVVTDPYVTFHEDKEWNSKDAGHVKKGEILKVLGYSYSSKNERWVKFEQGFLPLRCVTVYSNRFQAEKISKGLESK